jgi:hypothetical protein
MTTKTRRSFTDEFKQETVALLESSGRPFGQIAAELGIQPSMLRNWRRRFVEPGGTPRPLMTSGVFIMSTAGATDPLGSTVFSARKGAVNRGRVARATRHHGIRAKRRRAFRVCTTDSNHDLPVAPNLLNRKFSPGAPRRAWVADISDIPTDEGWLYLAVVLDLFSLKVLAWAMRDHMRTERPLAALRILMAAFVPGINHLRKKRVGPKPPFH